MGLGSDNELVALWNMVGKGQVTVRGSQHYSVGGGGVSLSVLSVLSVSVFFFF